MEAAPPGAAPAKAAAVGAAETATDQATTDQAATDQATSDQAATDQADADEPAAKPTESVIQLQALPASTVSEDGELLRLVRIGGEADPAPTRKTVGPR